MLLHHFHTLKGLFPEPILLAAPDIDRLRLSAITDPLTGLYNRRFLSESLRRHLFRAERSGDHVSVAMLDLENFKSINDRFGQSAGDRALVYTANTISESLRPGDIACRWGATSSFCCCRAPTFSRPSGSPSEFAAASRRTRVRSEPAWRWISTTESPSSPSTGAPGPS